jgi:hypothetical protein
MTDNALLATATRCQWQGALGMMQGDRQAAAGEALGPDHVP